VLPRQHGASKRWNSTSLQDITIQNTETLIMVVVVVVVMMMMMMMIILLSQDDASSPLRWYTTPVN